MHYYEPDVRRIVETFIGKVDEVIDHWTEERDRYMALWQAARATNQSALVALEDGRFEDAKAILQGTLRRQEPTAEAEVVRPIGGVPTDSGSTSGPGAVRDRAADRGGRSGDGAGDAPHPGRRPHNG